MTANFLLLLITFICLLSIPLLKYSIKWRKYKSDDWLLKNNKLNLKWIINLIIGVTFLIYFLTIRWLPDLKNLKTMDIKHSVGMSDYELYKYSYTYSKVFLLDWCPFFSIIFAIIAIFDRKMRIIHFFGFIVFCFGTLTIIGGFIENKNLNWSNFFEYVTIGIKPNSIYFGLHFFMAFFGLYNFALLKKDPLKTNFNFLCYLF
ncbi:DUF5378 family protein [Mycoplasma phocoenae]|uniref:DUF5378 family protein n=1 Tax=Mycoplasma phocoenae TaxID=754517 RepID=A0A858U859_9MOLU|nr:DUF5378 family protein [Mycoplasma phocoenae]